MLLQHFQMGVSMKRMGLDKFGSLFYTEQGNRYMTVAASYSTKWSEAFATPNQGGSAILGALWGHVYTFQNPEELHGDQEQSFEPQIFREVRTPAQC